MPRKKRPQNEIASNSSTSTRTAEDARQFSEDTKAIVDDIVYGERPGASALKDARALQELDPNKGQWLCREMAYVERPKNEPVSPGSRKYMERIKAMHAALGEHACVKHRVSPDGSLLP